ncbi:calmodulin-binding protein [Kitasatospora sp. CB02891]|uniref:BP74-related protein n=1 Tax=Kitasatospora sp. CB02891 TaxID=2020329 RepID=UPI000C271BD9|nr:calmodulin-binding protein [Kitasatospora sp. CB02891]PJN28236.1 calmodulin-binding protein [Kitasatospora sp. CB02891]
MPRVFTKAVGFAAVGVLAFATAQPSQASTTADQPVRAAGAHHAYFVMTDVTEEEFVIELTERDEIEHARRLVHGETADRPHVIARIIPRPARYNPRWSYHTDPGTTHFFDSATEVCDATIPYVEEHLDEAGGAFLPDYTWCDWSSHLVREIHAR